MGQPSCPNWPINESKSARRRFTFVMKRYDRSTPCDVRAWQILLQKSFCIDQHKFSGPYSRRSNNHLRDYIICDELTGDFGNGLEATSVGDLRLVCQFAGN